MRASYTRAMPISPRADRGATRASQAASDGARTERPRPSLIDTRIRVIRGLLSGSTVGFVGLDDLLHQRVPDDVLLVEVDECDAGNGADDFDGFDESGRAARRQVDLRDVAGDDGLRSKAEA